ncbi:hypothetical protein B2J86_01975 [Acidovorax sp. SRB_14]|uniref:GFA family protein n=1 Tax=unclassified Acidovorax TaxID=2684926 RepID=UPI00145FABBE|nr:hypothetical protein [Acidovorax sp. SRB_24]NMM78160.1 hypothetical protein [Acidovorax sp. SRB_24]NMM79707.1 hypothetical protein [Acidovorax sp. SRB_14]NMM84950.1 hypothetical protein [Rhodococcus sp. SRB_17]
MDKLIGSCKCGHVKFNVAGRAVQVVACHCGLCRSMTGAAYSSYVVVREQQFSVTQGSESLTAYAVTERTRRHFCKNCGTPLFNTNPETYKGLTMLYLGTVVGHEHLAPRIHIFCENKLPSVHLEQSSQCFPGAPTSA